VKQYFSYKPSILGLDLEAFQFHAMQVVNTTVTRGVEVTGSRGACSQEFRVEAATAGIGPRELADRDPRNRPRPSC